MILYNVTIKIDTAIHREWLQWMKEVHIPDVMATGHFKEHKICRIIGDEGPDGVTYAIQYLSPSMQAFQQYQQKHAPSLQAEHTARYEGRYAAFRTLMEVV